MSRFSELVTEPLSQTYTSLVEPDENPEPEGFTHSSTEVRSMVDADVDRPQDNLDEYWRLYETNPLIGQPINSVASKVMEAGWYLTADSESTVDELVEFGENVAIVNGEPNQNIANLFEQAVIQHQVKGTFVAEDVRNDDDKPTALNPLQVDTFEVYTKPGSNILLAPDDTGLEGIKRTSSGDAAAYVQFDADDSRWDRSEKRFSRDQILKWTRGNEVGEVFGTSRVEAVYERALALEAKLRDNDDAIAMKAWPMVLFQLGSEDNPWRPGEMDDFMADFDAENFGPGLMKAVSGDVSIEEFAGETADLEHAVATDVNLVISGMPTPKYALGAFAEQDAGEQVAAFQEAQYKKAVRRLRRDLEDVFTPYFQEVAEEYSLDSPDSVQLHVGRPTGDVAPEDVSGSIIRYQSDAGQGQQGQGQQGSTPARDSDGDGYIGDGTGSEQPAPGTPEARGVVALEEPETPALVPDGSGELVSTFDSDCRPCEPAELADPRLVSTTDLEAELSEAIFDALTRTRDRVLDQVRRRYNRAQHVPDDLVVTTIREAFEDEATRRSIVDTAEDTFREVASQTLDTLGQESHSPQLTVAYQSRHSRQVERTTDALESDLRQNVVNDLVVSMDNQLIQAADGGERVTSWIDRIEATLDDATLRRRARLIAHMRSQKVVNGIKVAEYEQTDGIVGVEVTNPCTDETTPLCRSLAGCGGGDGASARFDAPRSIGRQFSGQITDEMLFDGFDPLPSVPPYHFGCRSELVPIVE